jgi:hypothetical protein
MKMDSDNPRIVFNGDNKADCCEEAHCSKGSFSWFFWDLSYC